MTRIEELFLVRNQVQILYNQSLTTFLFPVIFALLLFFLLRGIATELHLFYWTTAVILFSAARYGMLWLYKKSTVSAENVHTWLWLFVITAFLSGILWGIAPVILIPYQHDSLVDYTLHNGLVLLLVCGLVAGAGITYSVNLLVMYAYSAPVLLLPSIYLILLGDKFSTILGGFLFLYFIFVNISVIRLNRQFQRYLQIEYRYEQLAAKYNELIGMAGNA